MAKALRISCDDCVMQDTDACEDCVVTFICGRDPEDAVIIDAAEERAVRMLARNGLVPELRHVQAVASGAAEVADPSDPSDPSGVLGAAGVSGA